MKRLTLDALKLQPLRIPAGWTIRHNSFFELDPGSAVAIDGLPDGDPWELFVEDLLQLEHTASGSLVDLGWMPEADPEGAFQVTGVRDGDWDHPVVASCTREHQEAVAAVEQALVRLA